MSGDDWGDIFAAALNGEHFRRPLGIADVGLANTAWSAKTVKAKNPTTTDRVRLISGRNNVLFSFGNDDVFADIQRTGEQILDIWNTRVGEATEHYPHLRTVVMIRNMEDFEFKVFEYPTSPFDPADYVWYRNARDNLEGYSRHGQLHTFTWQPDGSQFTIIRSVSGSARSFTVRKPDTIESRQFLANLGYDESWVTFL